MRHKSSVKKTHRLKIYDLQGNIFAETARGIMLGFTNIWRNKLLSIASITVMAVMLTIFNGILFVNHITKQGLGILNQKVDIVFYFKDGTDFYTANQLVSKLKKLPGVKNVEYISKEEALQSISKTYPETTDFLLKFNLKNPLPASISVSTFSAEYNQSIYDFISKTSLNQYIELKSHKNRTDEQSIISSATKNLININNFVKQLVFWVVLIFIIGGALIVINAIQLTIFNRRNEIFIMRLVGASHHFIRLPFITEGIIYAIIAVILSFFLLFLGKQTLYIESFEALNELSPMNMTHLFFIEMGICGILAVISSLITVKNYMGNRLNIS